ncbi:MAG: hypothetical protein JOZ87_04075 [Chloroflexi bacterium]|nr:hypothetical protein [Chloroflexota bacterium]MBV9596015.1 hypothetical protein [Chloroflexota bacterium]
MATGIGPLSDKRIRIAGLWGVGLMRITEGGWTLNLMSITWTDDAVFLMELGKSVYRGEGTKLTDRDSVLAFGFSETGRSWPRDHANLRNQPIRNGPGYMTRRQKART